MNRGIDLLKISSWPRWERVSLASHVRRLLKDLTPSLLTRTTSAVAASPRCWQGDLWLTGDQRWQRENDWGKREAMTTNQWQQEDRIRASCESLGYRAIWSNALIHTRGRGSRAPIFFFFFLLLSPLFLLVSFMVNVVKMIIMTNRI